MKGCDTFTMPIGLQAAGRIYPGKMWAAVGSLSISDYRHCDVGIGSRSEELDLSTKAADRASLFDHLVGAGEKRQWHFEAERLRCLEVDHRVELGRLLHRQVGRLLALEDAIDVTGCQAILVNNVRST
jgi:hypothetical protein